VPTRCVVSILFFKNKKATTGYTGLRIAKVTTASAPQGAQTVIYEYDEQEHLISEISGTGAPLRSYVWREDTPVAQIEYQPSRKILSFDPDHLNTPRAAMDETGKVVWRWESDAFGSTLPDEDPDKDGVKVTINLRFPGQYYDVESGLHYNGHRYYSLLLVIYTQADRLGLLRQAVNPIYAGYSESADLMRGLNQSYTYSSNNPMSETDPLGLMGSGVGSLNKKNQPKTPRYPGSSCGSEGNPNNYPNEFGGASIENACQRHDRCYEDCSKSKKQCDIQLYTDIRRDCDNASNPASCNLASIAYFVAVSRMGDDPFFNTRRKTCQCQ